MGESTRDIPRRADFRFWTEEKVRFGDIDRNSHVNNIALCRYCEDARVEFRAFCLPVTPAAANEAWFLVSFAIDFIDSMTYPGSVDVGTKVGSVGRSSLRLEHALFDGKRCLARATATTILVERETNRSGAIPENYRRALQAFA